MRTTPSVLLRTALLFVIAWSLQAAVAWTDALERDRDPLVLDGLSLPRLLGVDPARIAAFRFDGIWIQIPVQVDERAEVDFGTIYNIDPVGLTVLAHTDTSTWTGTDPDPTFDRDDELVLMAKDAGPRSGASAEPAGVLVGTGLEMEITAPLTQATAYAYLFETDGTLDPGAGENRISYEFYLLSGGYKETYDTMSGPNPEDTDLATAAYAVHFSDRWIRDETRVSLGDASDVDILDRHKALFGPGNCVRSEETFSAGEGAFIVNRTGPLRALRGYVGANSGPTTYRIHLFYEEREEIRTVLRVHPIPGIMDFFDYSPDASGMIYRNDLNPGGVLIDGNPDAVVQGQVGWEMASGLQGTLVQSTVIDTDLPAWDYTSYYSDDSTPPTTQCTGDSYEFGASGLWEDDPIPNTDPAVGPSYNLTAYRRIAYGPPDQGVAFAQECDAQARLPLTATATPYQPGASAVEGGRSGTGPEAVSMLTVGPNPFSENLRVGFALPGPTPIRVRLYDLSGRVVIGLVEGTWGRGSHELIRETSHLPSGVYLVRVEAGGGIERIFRLVRVR